MATAVGAFWLARYHLREARAYIEPALATATDALPVEARVQVLRNAYWVYDWLGEHDKAEPVAEERARVARASGDATLIAQALSSLAAAQERKATWKGRSRSSVSRWRSSESARIARILPCRR